jgi:uncharacterized protein (DUF58 family)
MFRHHRNRWRLVLTPKSPEKVLQRLEWTIIRRLDGLLQGNYRTLFHGSGLDLAELREYQATDDIRYIDWNVTARMQTPYVRQFIEDREVSAWFLLDLSPSVDFGTEDGLKREMLTDFVTLMARLLTKQGNRVGAIFYGDKVDRVMPPMGGRMQVLRLADCLLNQPQVGRAQATDLSVLLNTALGVIRRRSLVFLVSDFISEPGWEKPLAMITQRHEVLAVHLHDRREMELPDIGDIVFEDAETGEQMRVDTHDGGFRKRFAEAAMKREYDLETALHRVGVDVLSLFTGDDLAREIVRFASLRKQRRLSPVSFAR